MVALKHLKSQAVSLQAFAPWVSNPTAHIINRTLLKNPDGRYQSYDELIHNFGYALEQLQEHGNAPQQRARVVLETDEDRKGWTWVVLGMAVVMVGLLVAFFTMRPKSNTTAAIGTRTTGAVPAADTASSQGKFESLEGPVGAMAGREKDAVEKFREALASETLSPTDRAWAQYLEGVAALGTDRTMDARTAFGRVEPLAARTKDPALGKFFADSSARLVAGQRVALGDTAVLARSNYEAIGLLAYGLQNWQNGEIEDGAALLRQFRSAQPDEAYRWLNSLKPLANHYIEQLTEFEMALGRFKEAKTPAQRTAVANVIRGFSPALARRADAVIKPFAKEIEDQRLLQTKLPDEGLYRVTNRKSEKSLDVSGYHTGQGGALTQYDFRGQPNQIWELSKSGTGAYRFRPIHAFTSMDVPNSKLDDGLEIRTWTDNATSAQQWEVEPQGDGWYKLKSVCSNKFLTVQNQSTDNSAKVVQLSDKDGQDQQWKFEPLGRKLTDDWFASTIGPRHQSDKTEHKDGVFKLTDQGSDIWGRSDKANFVMRPVQGDFDLSVRVINPGKGHEWIKAGLMARPATNGDQMNVAAMISANHIATHQRRTNNGEDTFSTKIPDQAFPHWLKIERRGNKFTTFHSVDGQTWQEIANDTIKMHNHVLIGLVLTSHDPNKAATAEFDNLTYTKK
jgi:regulation of enolase protein 1 (concanavalin A-like superfamily)